MDSELFDLLKRTRDILKFKVDLKKTIHTKIEVPKKLMQRMLNADPKTEISITPKQRDNLELLVSEIEEERKLSVEAHEHQANAPKESPTKTFPKSPERPINSKIESPATIDRSATDLHKVIVSKIRKSLESKSITLTEIERQSEASRQSVREYLKKPTSVKPVTQDRIVTWAQSYFDLSTKTKISQKPATVPHTVVEDLPATLESPHLSTSKQLNNQNSEITEEMINDYELTSEKLLPSLDDPIEKQWQSILAWVSVPSQYSSLDDLIVELGWPEAKPWISSKEMPPPVVVRGFSQFLQKFKPSVEVTNRLPVTGIPPEVSEQIQSFEMLLVLLEKVLRWFQQQPPEIREVLRKTVHGPDVGYMTSLLNMMITSEGHYEAWRSKTTRRFTQFKRVKK